MSESQAPYTTGRPLTDLQQRLYTAVVDFWLSHGYCPQVRELTKLARISSTSVVAYNLDKLQARGLILMEPGVTRTIRPANYSDWWVNGKPVVKP